MTERGRGASPPQSDGWMERWRDRSLVNEPRRVRKMTRRPLTVRPPARYLNHRSTSEHLRKKTRRTQRWQNKDVFMTVRKTCWEKTKRTGPYWFCQTGHYSTLDLFGQTRNSAVHVSKKAYKPDPVAPVLSRGTGQNSSKLMWEACGRKPKRLAQVKQFQENTAKYWGSGCTWPFICINKYKTCWWS